MTPGGVGKVVAATHDTETIEAVLRYHERTKHHFNRYAPGPSDLDWANQPIPFRRYEGTLQVRRPLIGSDDGLAPPHYDDLYRRGVASRHKSATRSRHIPATWSGAEGHLEGPCGRRYFAVCSDPFAGLLSMPFASPFLGAGGTFGSR
jgi:hypothetical protein